MRPRSRPASSCSAVLLAHLAELFRVVALDVAAAALLDEHAALALRARNASAVGGERDDVVRPARGVHDGTKAAVFLLVDRAKRLPGPVSADRAVVDVGAGVELGDPAVGQSYAPDVAQHGIELAV